jgi:hypothetical protein
VTASPGLLPLNEKKPGGTPGGGDHMEPYEEPQPEDASTGTCRRCGTTFIDVYDFQEAILPDYVPVRLAEYRDGNETTLAEWCSRTCFLDEVAKDPQSLIREVRSAPLGTTQRDAR